MATTIGNKIKKKFRKLIRMASPSMADIFLNLKALRSNDKSQFGEQKLLIQILNEQRNKNLPKLYLELGAAYPIFHSNSHALSKLNYKGVSYDADKRYQIQWRLLRGKDEFKTAAIVTTNSQSHIVLHKFPSSHSSLSTTSLEQNMKWEEQYKKLSKPVVVKAKAIKDVYVEFAEKFGNNPSIVLTDLEGIDKEIILNLLTNIKLDQYPKILLIEAEINFLEEENLITSFYNLRGKAGLSLLLQLK